MAKLQNRPTGMGRHPALLIVDVINAFTDPACPLGSLVDVEVGRIQVLLERFRAHGLPVYYTTQAYSTPDQASVWREKLPGLAWLTAGSTWVEVDARVRPLATETVVTKLGPSAFFETDLKARLLRDGVDTVFVTGFTTSGCIRASTVDAVSGNFRALVVADACGDRDPQAHESNLYDLAAKYADLISTDAALQLLAQRYAKAS